VISRVIEFSVRNRFIVCLGAAALAFWGVWCLYRTPIDAIPDLSENQVIVWADWPGRSPREVEDQVTYPLSVNLQGLAGVRDVRSTSEFGFGMVNVIFEDAIGVYFARERVIERLAIAGSFLPSGVVPYLAPDATALGQIFWYTIEGEGKSLDELRNLQDWYVRYQLKVPGVADVASVGGFVREYQVDVDPEKLRAYDVSLGQVFRALMAANSSVGGKVVHTGGTESLVRGYGLVGSLDDVRNVVVVERDGVPITVDVLASVELGPAFRRGLLEKDGREAVGGVVLMRYGENPLEVTERIKAKVHELQAGLPPGVRIAPFYERTALIEAATSTLKRTLVEEILIASLVVFLVLWHLRSAVVICATLPLAVLVAFIFMYYLEIPSNIMSLSGIAISIGVLVDAGIVMTENAYNRLHQQFGGAKVTGDTRPLVIEACKTVGGPLFFSVLIMLLSFAPVFVLGGLEGKMFNPLAYTKSFALAGVAVLAITLVPAMIPTFVRGRLKAQEDVWLVRSLVNIYRPMLAFFIRHPGVIVVISGAIFLLSLPIFPRKVPWLFFVVLTPFMVALTMMLVAKRKAVCFVLLFLIALTGFFAFRPLGEEFMPSLDELSLLDMPITRPNVNITQAGFDLKVRDAVLREFPEVHQVAGKLGRADTPTDPAPVDMVETVVSLRAKDAWPKRKVHFDEANTESVEVTRALLRSGVLKPMPEDEVPEFANVAAMAAVTRFDRLMRELSIERLREDLPERTRELLRTLRSELVRFLRAKGALKAELADADWLALEEKLVREYAARFDEWVQLEDVERAAGAHVELLAARGAVEKRPDLLVRPHRILDTLSEPIFALTGGARSTFTGKLRQTLERRQHALRVASVRRLNWEIADRAAGTMVWLLIEAALEEAKTKDLVAREPSREELHAVRAEREAAFGRGLFLWQKLKVDLQQEMDSALRVPGWGNIWTQPIINRVNMLATGVRTMVGVKVFGRDVDTIQRLCEEIREVLKLVPGAADVSVDQISGESYLEVHIDRKQAARYGVRDEAVQEAVEVALGGKEVSMVIDGRQRYPLRVRYPRDWRGDKEAVENLLVAAEGAGEADMEPAGGGAAPGGPAMGAPAPARAAAVANGGGELRLRQVPLSLVADVRFTQGPSMIKSENGLLRSYVQLNVRDRDVVGFVEEARRAVEAKVKLPEGYYTAWTGQFEHQVRAQRTLTVVLPLVLLIIFIILYLTYRDLPDTFLMFLAVPGAVAGGALFQYITGYNFSVAVWVGYIACFGLATETGIVMMVYLREAIERRGGMEKIETEAQIQEAVMEGAVHRLRPKLLTEGTTILALIPMLWATGVGAEFMRPMAAPILGGILVADEVIDVLLPVLFYYERVRRLRKRRAAGGGAGDGIVVPAPAEGASGGVGV
jgi:Cu(I)/Ag(I) efflux system membrane protein CusA/SilA